MKDVDRTLNCCGSTEGHLSSCETIQPDLLPEDRTEIAVVPDAVREMWNVIAIEDEAAGYDVARIEEGERPLDAAWAEAEAAMPEGWRLFSVSRPGAADRYWAQAHGPIVMGRCDMGREHEEYPRANGYGPTPADALRDLARDLRAALAASDEAARP